MLMRLCSWKDCQRKHKSKGLCRLHYMRRRRGGLMDAPVVGRGYPPEPTKNRMETVRWSRFRVTPPMWEKMLKDQGGVCRMCREREAVEVDHFHAPGTDPEWPQDITLIRGVVCHRCNIRLGKYETETRRPLKNPRLIRMVEAYLELPRPFPE